MEFSSIFRLWNLQIMEIWTLIIVFFSELSKIHACFYLQSVVFILWLLAIASSPSSLAQRSSVHVTLM